MAGSTLKPWEIHAALKRNRLAAVGRLIWDARVSAAKDAKPKLGDNLWDIGCKAYSRTRSVIIRAAVGVHADWLSLQDRGQHFVFTIGGVPIRFYRGDLDDDVPNRYAQADEKELQVLELAFELADTPTPDAIFRIIVGTDHEGFPTKVVLAQVEPYGMMINPWRIPIEEAETVFSMEEAKPKPTIPDRPTVGDEEVERASEKREHRKEDDLGQKKKGA